jgi:hypothetical protein
MVEQPGGPIARGQSEPPDYCISMITIFRAAGLGSAATVPLSSIERSLGGNLRYALSRNLRDSPSSPDLTDTPFRTVAFATDCSAPDRGSVAASAGKETKQTHAAAARKGRRQFISGMSQIYIFGASFTPFVAEVFSDSVCLQRLMMFWNVVNGFR